MTLVIAKENKDKIYIASDGLGSNNHSKIEYGRKIIQIKNFFVGYSGSFRVAQLIEFNKNRFKNIESKKDIFDFCQKLKKILEDNGFKKEADFLKEPENTSVLILATKVGLFEIERNYQFIKTDISAIGSGSDFAYGYMAGSNSDYKQRMIRAIKECSKKIVSVGNKTYFQVYKKYDRTK